MRTDSTVESLVTKEKNMTPTRTLVVISAAALLGLGLASCSAEAPGTGDGKPATGSFGQCELTGEAGSIELDTLTKDTLTVATVLPSNGWWNGTSPETIDSGFEYCMTANIAHRAGLSTLKLQNQSWDQLISASNTTYDLGMAAITITDERKEVFDFSEPYFESNLGVAIREGDDVTEANIRDKKVGVLQGNMGAQYTTETLKPAGGVQQFQAEVEMFTALRAGQIDAVITDTTLALSNTAASGGELVVTGQFSVDQSYGIITEKGGKNSAAVSAAIADMREDGTLDALSAEWLTPLFGADPNQIPVWK